MNEKIYKTTLATRVMPSLKETILAEAKENDLTTSNYVETILKDRNKGFHNDTDLYNQVEALRKENADLLEELNAVSDEDIEASDNVEEIAHLNAVIDDLTTSNESLENQINDLKMEQVDRSGQIADLEASSLFFSDKEKKELQDLLVRLRKYYPTLTDNQIVLGGLFAALKNENSSLWITTIEKYRKQLEGAKATELVLE